MPTGFCISFSELLNKQILCIRFLFFVFDRKYFSPQIKKKKKKKKDNKKSRTEEGQFLIDCTHKMADPSKMADSLYTHD